MRVLFWNTFLLRVRLGPLSLHRGAFVTERAHEIAAALAAADYDIAAFTEVFDAAEQATLQATGDWQAAAAGPPSARWPLPAKSSGLYTLSRLPVATA